ncbi:MAG TPA: nucleotidyl transferase AbiEii/AbiGii toxin family protein, partial [Candidatus Avalokitesvara rifleensis]|uniref:nucleotidyl transferase AbiEii/AbiGii toxin family protein n=1 Tax=Candidatus Avalokitesvara rifleensis TaxID=3367620 RepID=UPI00402549C1
SSPIASFQILAQVATLEQLYEDKMACLTGREKPKDLFDLWYLSQKLSQPMPPVKSRLPVKRIRQELRKYLPRSFWKVIEELHVP